MFWQAGLFQDNLALKILCAFPIRTSWAAPRKCTLMWRYIFKIPGYITLFPSIINNNSCFLAVDQSSPQVIWLAENGVPQRKSLCMCDTLGLLDTFCLHYFLWTLGLMESLIHLQTQTYKRRFFAEWKMCSLLSLCETEVLLDCLIYFYMLFWMVFI